MTRYEQGFMNKCAEYGVPNDSALELLKTAQIREGLRNIGSGVANRFKEGFKATKDFMANPGMMRTNPFHGFIYNKQDYGGWSPATQQMGRGFTQVGQGIGNKIQGAANKVNDLMMSQAQKPWYYPGAVGARMYRGLNQAGQWAGNKVKGVINR